MDSIVETRTGTLLGRVVDGADVFKGVPYAAPPFGPNHLRPPQPVLRWGGVRDALAFGPKPPQVAVPPGFEDILAERVSPGEDCLTLNVWTPGTGAAERPVMVWIPGGMFQFHATGATAVYDGGRFARDGVVCVTINYRVGAEGFLCLDDGIANLGLLDQIAALQWVQDNIAAFGGDPANVTVFGQSAGAISIGALLSMPGAQGLFHRAIVQSGPPDKVISAATAQRIGRRLAGLLGVEPTRDAIAACAPDRLLQAQAKLQDDLLARPDPAFWGEVALTSLPWAPTVDGQSLPDDPMARIAAGAAADIALLVGTNLDETRFFLVPGGAIDRIGEQDLLQVVQAHGLPPDTGLGAYRAAFPGARAGELLSAIQTDGYWRLPALRLADAHSASARAATYMYEFGWRSPQYGGRLRAAHGVEIPFVFDTLDVGTERLLGPDPPQALADAMHRAWMTFATSGHCPWPRYDATRRATMHFDAPSRVVDDPMATVRAAWQGGPASASPGSAMR